MMFAFSMITRWFVSISILLLSSAGISAAFGQESKGNQSGWRATVACDSVVVYSQMSIQSKIMGHLKRADIVTIEMEFISAGGTWCSVAGPGKRGRLGFVQGECLEREEMESFTRWEAQSLPAQTMPDAESVQHVDRTTEKRPTREEIEQEVDRVVASRLKALQLANEPPVQLIQQEPFGFDDRTSFLFLPRFGLPLNFLHHTKPRINPSVQIRPSHNLRRR